MSNTNVHNLFYMDINFDELLSESDNVFTKMKSLGICHHNRLEVFNVSYIQPTYFNNVT